jgi:hypothetical protein
VRTAALERGLQTCLQSTEAEAARTAALAAQVTRIDTGLADARKELQVSVDVRLDCLCLLPWITC